MIMMEIGQAAGRKGKARMKLILSLDFKMRRAAASASSWKD